MNVRACTVKLSGGLVFRAWKAKRFHTKAKNAFSERLAPGFTFFLKKTVFGRVHRFWDPFVLFLRGNLGTPFSCMEKNRVFKKEKNVEKKRQKITSKTANFRTFVFFFARSSFWAPKTGNRKKSMHDGIPL